jgi:hypothetical protein
MDSFEDENTVTDLYTTDGASGPLVQESVRVRGKAAEECIGRIHQLDLPRGDDDGVSDMESLYGDASILTENEMFRAAVEAEERKIMTQYDIKLERKQSFEYMYPDYDTSSLIQDNSVISEAPKQPGSFASSQLNSLTASQNSSGITKKIGTRTSARYLFDRTPNVMELGIDTKPTDLVQTSSSDQSPSPKNDYDEPPLQDYSSPVARASRGNSLPRLIVVGRAGDKMGGKAPGDSRKQSPCGYLKQCATNLWRDKTTRLLTILALIVLVAICVAVGSFIVYSKSSTSKSSASSEYQPSEQDLTELPRSMPTPAPTFAMDESSNVKKTETPTRQPTKTPMRQPTIQVNFNRPTLAPTVQSPTVAPTGIPAGEPTGNPANVDCEDDANAIFFINSQMGDQNCEWLSERPAHISSLCNLGYVPYTKCRKLCRSCSVTEPPTKSPQPTKMPTPRPTKMPTTKKPTPRPTKRPTAVSDYPSLLPSAKPAEPTIAPTLGIIVSTQSPTLESSTSEPTGSTQSPTLESSTSEPTFIPTLGGTTAPTEENTEVPAVESNTNVRETVLSGAPSSTSSALSDSGSPQAKAMEWLEASNVDWLNDVQIRQRFALATFGFGSDPDQWSNSTRWLDETRSVCSWSGIKCNANEQVTSIRLNENEVEGTLPPELSMLADTLETIDVGNNHLQGRIPSDFTRLRNLNTLKLERNDLNGELPEQIGQMTSLKVFDFHYNAISGTIPDSIVNLENLKELVFWHNDITGDLPDAVCDLPNLVDLMIDCREVISDCWTRCYYQCGGDTGVSCDEPVESQEKPAGPPPETPVV